MAMKRSEGMIVIRAWREMPGWSKAKAISGIASGLRKIRGSAEVKYQCQGETPHSDEEPKMAL